MQLETFNYSADRRWSVQPMPALDSPQTLVLVFGATGFIDNPAPFQELRAAYPQAQLVGCSTSGEIFNTEILDDTLVVAVAKFEGTRLATAHVPLKHRKDS